MCRDRRSLPGCHGDPNHISTCDNLYHAELNAAETVGGARVDRVVLGRHLRPGVSVGGRSGHAMVKPPQWPAINMSLTSCCLLDTIKSHHKASVSRLLGDDESSDWSDVLLRYYSVTVEYSGNSGARPSCWLSSVV